MGTIQLNKQNSGVGDGSVLEGVTHLRFGASWDPSTRGARKKSLFGAFSKKVGLDIDLIAVLMQGKKPVKWLGLDNVDPLKNKVILHSGDNTTGAGDGDDESITVDLTKLPLEYSAIVFTASVFKGDAMNALAVSSDTARKLAAALTYQERQQIRLAALTNGFKGADNVEFTVYNDSPGGGWDNNPLIMPDLRGTANCCIIARVVRTSMTDMSAPWKIEILEQMVPITPGDMDSIYDVCVNVVP